MNFDIKFRGNIAPERKKFETLSQSAFDAKVSNATDNEPLRKEVELKEIEIASDKAIKYKGQYVAMTDQAFKDLAGIVGLPVGFDKTFTKNFGNKARAKLLQRLQTATAANGQATVTMIVNPLQKAIVAFHNKKTKLISHASFLDTTTSLIDRYNLEVNNFTIGPDGGLIINAASPGNHFGVKGLQNEEFFGGVTFKNDLHNGFEVSPYLHRLICANGMIGDGFEEVLKLGGLEPKMSEDFFVQLNQMAERGFKPMGLDSHIKVASSTPASLAEMRDAYETLKASSGGSPQDLNEWIPYPETVQAFRSHGIKTETLNEEQLKRAKTGTSIWNVINGLTHFGTHDNGFHLGDSSRRRMQREAGLLLTKKKGFDIQNIVSSPFDKVEM